VLAATQYESITHEAKTQTNLACLFPVVFLKRQEDGHEWGKRMLKFKEVTAILTISSSGEADLCARTFSSCSSWREEEDERSTYQTE